MNILYVEDNPSDSDLLLRHFSSLKDRYMLMHVGTIAAAIEQLEKCTGDKCDIVLTDFQLPDGTGLDLLYHIRSRRFPLGVVMITSQGDEQTAVNALKSGADDYVPKSFDYLETLPAILADVYDRTRGDSSLQKTRLRALYAEHLATDIDLTKRHLAGNAPYIEIDVVNDAIQLLKELRKHPVDQWDVLLLDYQLPGMNALEALREINHLGKHPPVIIVTGQGDEQVAAQALRLGAVDYIVKHPGYLYELAPSMESAYHRAKMQSEHEALKLSEEKYKALFDQTGEGIYLHTKEGEILAVNDAGCRQSGYHESELLKLKIFDLHPKTSEKNLRVKEILNLWNQWQLRETHSFEAEHQRKDGTIYPVEVRSTKIHYANQEVFLAIVNDITIRREAEKTVRDYNERLEKDVELRTNELKAMQEQLIQQDRLANLGRLAGGMAHELRNPLGVISNAVYYLRMILPDANEKVKEYLGILEKESQAAVQIMSDLLNFSTLQTGDRHPAGVKDLLDRVLKAYPPLSSIKIDTRVPDHCADVFVDSHQIEMAISRIVVNAYQAMEKGGTLKIDVQSPSKAKGEFVTITFTDSGSGIVQEDQGKVFEPLFTTKPRHIGLGLSISKRLIEVNGGNITLESKWGKGTTVTVTLPVKAEG